MPRFALPLMAAIALLLGATAAHAAPAGPAAAPTARVADDLDDSLDDECVLDEDCLDEDWGDEELACEDDLWGDEDWDDEELSDEETLAEIATADDLCEDDVPALTRLSASVTGTGAKLTVQVAFRLDAPAKVRLTLARLDGAASKRTKRACSSAAAAKTKQGKRKGKGKQRGACAGTLPGHMTVAGKAGLNRVVLRGRWQGRKLAPGSYRLTATPKAPGAASAKATFKLAG